MRLSQPAGRFVQVKVYLTSLHATGEACVDALLTGRRVLSEGCASSLSKPVGQASSVQLTKQSELTAHMSAKSFSTWNSLEGLAKSWRSVSTVFSKTKARQTYRPGNVQKGCANSLATQATGCAEQIRLSKPKQESGSQYCQVVGACRHEILRVIILWLLTLFALFARAIFVAVNGRLVGLFGQLFISTFRLRTCSISLVCAYDNHQGESQQEEKPWIASP